MVSRQLVKGFFQLSSSVSLRNACARVRMRGSVRGQCVICARVVALRACVLKASVVLLPWVKVCRNVMLLLLRGRAYVLPAARHVMPTGVVRVTQRVCLEAKHKKFEVQVFQD